MSDDTKPDDTKPAEVEIEATDVDPELVAASNLDVAKLKSYDEVEPEPEPKPKPANPYGNTPYGQVYGARDPLDDSNVHLNSDPETTSNVGDGSAPLGERITTPIEGELMQMTMIQGQQTDAEVKETAAQHSGGSDNAGGGNGGESTGQDANANRPTGFAALSNVENK